MIRAAGRYLVRHHLGLMALFIVLGGTALAVSAQPDAEEVRTCLSRKKGTLRVVEAKKECRRGERLLIWNRIGPAGPAGPSPAPEPWHLVGTSGEPGFSTNWQAVPGSPLGFRRTAGGQVFLKGRASGVNGWIESVFTLPSGFRPQASVRVPIASPSFPAEARIEPNGEVVPIGPLGPGTVAHFEGLNFSSN